MLEALEWVLNDEVDKREILSEGDGVDEFLTMRLIMLNPRLRRGLTGNMISFKTCLKAGVERNHISCE